MIITKKKVVVAVFVVLFLLAISPYSNAQEEAIPPANEPAVTASGEISKEETIYLVQDLAANAATKLRTAISRTEQILGRLNSRSEKIIAPEGYDPSEGKQLADEAAQLLAEASQSLENIESDVEGIFELTANPQESWQAIGSRFN